LSKILIAYLTKTNTTKEIADEIAGIFKSRDIAAEVKAIPEIKDLSSYSGVIVGAPINGMVWLPEAYKFIEDNKEVLKNMPTAYFFVSYMIEEGREFWKNKIRKSLDSAKALVRPVSVGMFGGRVTSGFPAIFRFIFGIKKDALKDVRDWNKIRIWANDISKFF